MVNQAQMLALMGFHVFPVAPGKKKPPLISGWHLLATTNETKIQEWWEEFPTANPAISTTAFGDGAEALLVIDVDTKNGKNGNASLEALEKKIGKLPDTYTQHTPTGGRHIVFKCPEAVKQDAGRLGDGLDTRSWHGYIMASGATLPGEGDYTCNYLPVEDAPASLLALFTTVNEQERQRQRQELTAEFEPDQIDIDWVTGQLQAAPVADPGVRSAAAYKLACVARDYGLGALLTAELLLEHWNSRCPVPLDQAEVEGVVCNAFRYATSPGGQKKATNFLPDVGDLAGSVDADAADAEKQNVAVLMDDFTADPYPDYVSEINKEFAFIMAGADGRILWRNRDPNGHEKIELITVEAFHNWMANRYTMVNNRMVPASKEWMKSPGRRNYRGIVFDPTEATSSRDFYNMWKGLPHMPRPGETFSDRDRRAVEKFKDHILRNVCRGNYHHARWVTGYLAHMVQRPGEKAHVALVLRGGKGTGKSFVASIMDALLGSHSQQISHARGLKGHFNEHLANKILYVLEEVTWAGDNEADGILKDLITGAQINIEPKGRSIYKIKNFLRIIIISNEKWTVNASRDERRYAVFEMGSGNQQDRMFFGSMASSFGAAKEDDSDRGVMKIQKAGSGLRCLMDYLLKFDLSEIDVNTAPATQALQDQKVHGMSIVLQWWADCLAEEQLLHCHNFEWPPYVAKSTITQAIRQYAQSRNARERLPSVKDIFAMLFEACPGAQEKKMEVPMVEKDTRVMCFLPPNIQEAKKQWDRYLGAIEKRQTKETG